MVHNKANSSLFPSHQVLSLSVSLEDHIHQFYAGTVGCWLKANCPLVGPGPTQKKIHHRTDKKLVKITKVLLF